LRGFGPIIIAEKQVFRQLLLKREVGSHTCSPSSFLKFMETLWESNALTNSGFDTPPFELPMFLLISPGTELTPNGLVTAVIFHL